MNDTQTSSHYVPDAPRLAARIGRAAEDVVGVACVSSFGASDRFAAWVATTDAWIFFFLVTKPLWDLTWRWRFFQLFGQGVNIQTFVGLFVLGMNAVAIYYRASWRRLPRLVLIFVGCATLSVLLSFSAEGFNELLRLLAGVGFFYSAGPLLANRARFDRFRKLFLCATSVPILLSFLQVAGVLPYEYWDWNEAGEVGRASGTYQHPLDIIFFLIVATPLALSLAYDRTQSRSARRWAWVFLVLATLALVFTYHRTAYFVMAFQFVIWFCVTLGWKGVLRLLAALALVVFLGISQLTVLYAPLAQSVSGDVDVTSGQFLRGRGLQWYLFLDSYVSGGPFHWIFGKGDSVLEGISPDDPVIDYNEPHNDFIRLLHAYGAVGLLLYVSTVLLFLRRSLLLLRSPDKFARSVALVMILILTAVAILSMVAEPLRFPAGAWYFFAIGAALFCLDGRAPQAQDG